MLAALAACGGGNTTVTTITGGPAGSGLVGPTVSVDVPTGSNTTEIVVDSGPASGFSLGVANIPYVTVTVCSPGSSTDCATIDHVFLDTGSVGFRVLKSAVSNLALPPVVIPADAPSATPAGDAMECFPFVLGAVWGGVVTADLRIAGEMAASLPIQVIDDAAAPVHAAPANCVSSSNGGLLNSVTALQANGVLGIGMIKYDCGLICATGDYSGGYTLYYSCPSSVVACVPAAIPANLQMQNPVAHFPVDNNGTVITLPAVPEFGAALAKGRLVFGIGTQSNNQIPPSAKMYFVDADPKSATYLYLSTSVGAKTYTNSYIDSGSNALFFDDGSIRNGCAASSGSVGGWYCPPSTLNLTATVFDAKGDTGQVAFSVASADTLFLAPNMAFADLAGSVGQGADIFVWGLPFFYGRSVMTSIWGQTLSPNGPWLAF
ncbi:MAG: DUF3443 family protein [Burkholderiales bacterium]